MLHHHHHKCSGAGWRFLQLGRARRNSCHTLQPLLHWVASIIFHPLFHHFIHPTIALGWFHHLASIVPFFSPSHYCTGFVPSSFTNCSIIFSISLLQWGGYTIFHPLFHHFIHLTIALGWFHHLSPIVPSFSSSHYCTRSFHHIHTIRSIIFSISFKMVYKHRTDISTLSLPS